MDNFDENKLESIFVVLVIEALLSNQKWVQVYFTQKISFWETTILNCKRRGGGHWGPLKRVY